MSQKIVISLPCTPDIGLNDSCEFYDSDGELIDEWGANLEDFDLNDSCELDNSDVSDEWGDDSEEEVSGDRAQPSFQDLSLLLKDNGTRNAQF